MLNLLKDHVRLQGSYQQPPMLRWGSIVLHRDGESDNYSGYLTQTLNTSVVKRADKATAALKVINGMPELQIRAVLGRHEVVDYVLNRFDQDEGSMSGGHKTFKVPVELQVVQSWSAEEWKVEMAARTKLLQEGLSADVSFRGAIGSAAGGERLHLPVELALQSGAAGAVTGKATFPAAENATADVVGKVLDDPLGQKIQLQFGDGKGSPKIGIPLLQWMQPCVLELTLLDAGASATFAGQIRTKRGVTYAAQFTRSDKKHSASLKPRLQKMLSKGAAFRMLSPMTRRQEMAQLQLQLDASSGKITGSFDALGSLVSAAPPATLAGGLEEKDGWLSINLAVVQPADAKGSLPTRFKLYVVESGSELRLLGAQTYNGQQYQNLELIVQ